MNSKKIANNMLEFLVNPRTFPVERRLYFRPEELLDNSWYENAVINSEMAYGDQSKNSDFYPLRNRLTKREAGIMDRKTIIASLDVLSQAFKEDNPMAKDLRTMAYAVSRMSDEELESKLNVEASAWTDFIKKFKKEHPDMSMKEVLQEAGKAYKKEKKAEDEIMEATENELIDNWTKEANDAVQNAIILDVLGDKIAEKKKRIGPGGHIPDATGPHGRGAGPGKGKGDGSGLQEKEASNNKEAGKKKGPGKPDGTGPYAETPECQMSEKGTKKKTESDKEAGKKKGPGKPDGTGPYAGTSECQKAEKEISDSKEAKNPENVVNTDILATVNYDGIEFNDTMNAMDKIDLSQEEQDRLSQLFK